MMPHREFDAKVSSPLKVALVGFGATGQEIASVLAQRPDLELVAVVDSAARRHGQQIPGAPGVSVEAHASPEKCGANVVAVATSSRLEGVLPTIKPWLEAGVNVVSLCEELGYPWRSHHDLAAEIDGLAKRGGATVLGAGANPGFVMDLLPLVLSATLPSLRRIDVRRTVDLADYGDLIWRFGLGKEVSEFDADPSSTGIEGHVGFAQSLAHLVEVAQLEADELVVSEPEPAATTETARRGPNAVLPAGSVCASRHSGQALSRGEVVVTLTGYFAFRPTDGEVPVGDHWTLTAPDERTVEFACPRGLPSLVSTAALLCNALPAATSAPAGLLTMSDLPPRDYAARPPQPGFA